jgi:hypothetical protein
MYVSGKYVPVETMPMLVMRVPSGRKNQQKHET